MAEKEKKDLTGLDSIPEGASKKDAELDITTALLKAAEFRTSDEAMTEIEIKRNGVFFFSFKIHPVSDKESRVCRKKATKYMPNPNGRKLPPIEKEFDSAKFHSMLIYTATADEDKKKIWGNQTILDKYDLMEPYESIDVLLAVGEKLDIVDAVLDISGMSEDEETTPEEYAKN